MNRITNKRLENRVNLLNDMLGLPAAPYTRANGKLTANIGNLHLYYAYGGVDLHQMQNNGGGVRSLTGGCGTKRELDTFISGMIEALRTANDIKAAA